MPKQHPSGLLVEDLGIVQLERYGWKKTPIDPIWYGSESVLIQCLSSPEPLIFYGRYLLVRRRYRGDILGKSSRYYLNRESQILELPIPQDLKDRNFDSSSSSIELRIEPRRKYFVERSDKTLMLPSVQLWELAGY